MIVKRRNTSWNINEGNDDGNKLTTLVKKMTSSNDNESMADNNIIRITLVLHHLRRRGGYYPWLLTHISVSFYLRRPTRYCVRV